MIETASKSPLGDRLGEIFYQISNLIDRYHPDQAGIESLFFATNAKTAIAVGEARGVVLLAFCQKKLPYREFTPLQVKQAVTGYGKASKDQVQRMVKTLLKLDAIPRPDDAADAVAVALTLAATRI